jgi:hypothetical protein
MLIFKSTLITIMRLSTIGLTRLRRGVADADLTYFSAGAVGWEAFYDKGSLRAG